MGQATPSTLTCNGFFLNPKCFCSNAFEPDEEVIDGLNTINIEMMISNDHIKELIPNELQAYKKVEGMVFSSIFCKKLEENLATM